MRYSKKEIESIVEKVIGQNQLKAIGLPRAIEETAIILFIKEQEDVTQSEKDLIRKSISDLRDLGSLQF